MLSTRSKPVHNSGMDYALEPATPALFDEILPLLRLHYAEVHPDKDIPLNPNFNSYLRMQDAGVLRVYTARDADGLQGYAAFIVMPSLHFMQCLTAVCDLIFLHPTKRGGGTSLLLWVHEQFESEGVAKAFIHLQADHDKRALMERLGYRLEELNYTRRFDGGA